MSWPQPERQTSAPRAATLPAWRADWRRLGSAPSEHLPCWRPRPVLWPGCRRCCMPPHSGQSGSGCPSWRSSRPAGPCFPCAGKAPGPTSMVMRSFAGRPIIRKVSLTFRSESTFRKGDCPSSTASACFSASSKTASPVLLVKSASTTVSFSVSVVAVFAGALRNVNAGRVQRQSIAAMRRQPRGQASFQSLLLGGRGSWRHRSNSR